MKKKDQIRICFIIICISFILMSCNANKSSEVISTESVNESISASESTKASNIDSIKDKIIKTDGKVNNEEKVNSNIEYDVYKKIDLSKYYKNEKQDSALIHPIESIYIADTPCKVTVKASIKIEKGPGLPEKDINDMFAISMYLGAVSTRLYYADYGNEYFGNFHEIERVSNHFTELSSKGKVYLSDVGIASMLGSSGWKEKYVSHNETEYVGEFLTQDKTQTKVKVTIKDIYYKISKLTDKVIESEWDLDKDFEVVTFYEKQCLNMRNLDSNYNYTFIPKFTINVNDGYDKRWDKMLVFNYISDENIPESCGRVMSEKKLILDPRYNNIGIGTAGANWMLADVWGNIDVLLEWDKNSKTAIIKEKNGKVVATIVVDYIKEYKYKPCAENITPGYNKYLMAIKQNTINNNIQYDKSKKDGKAMQTGSKSSDAQVKEIYDNAFESKAPKETQINIKGNVISYSIPQYSCASIPKLAEIIEKAVNESLNSFFTEYFSVATKEVSNVYFNVKLPNDHSLSDIESINNYISLKYDGTDNIGQKLVKGTIYIDLCNPRYSYSGYWKYRDTIGATGNTKEAGKVNILINRSRYDHIFEWNDMGYPPNITDWKHEPIEDIKEIGEADVGDYIHFGTFTTNFSDGGAQGLENYIPKQDVEWKVLDKDGDKLLIVTRQAIGCADLSNFMESVTWETCKARSWLNNEFYNTAFNADEKNKIVDGNDKLFALSQDEVNKYFSSDVDRQCKATSYARQKYCWYSKKNGICGNCNYILRTPAHDFGDGKSDMMCVDHLGKIVTSGCHTIYNMQLGIRPAMWIRCN